ncbi:MAG: methyltransferase domain-containing protein [Alphaproteobacteria bacterium]|nr:methyltransferase domain-containing protein [Alphaproteobacteria bacterium]
MKTCWKQNVAGAFDRQADCYDLHAQIQTHAAARLAEALPALDAPVILEIGCGTGALSEILTTRYPKGRFYVSDISPSMIARTKARLAQTHPQNDMSLIVMDGETPCFAGRPFDLVVGNMSAQWFHDPAGGLARLCGLLKPGGTLFYSVPGPDNFHQWRSVLELLELPSGLLELPPLPGLFDEERIPVRYEGAYDFLRRVKSSGAGTAKAGYDPLAPGALRKACRLFDARFDAAADWHILYGRLEARS